MVLGGRPPGRVGRRRDNCLGPAPEPWARAPFACEAVAKGLGTLAVALRAPGTSVSGCPPSVCCGRCQGLLLPVERARSPQLAPSAPQLALRRWRLPGQQGRARPGAGAAHPVPEHAAQPYAAQPHTAQAHAVPADPMAAPAVLLRAARRGVGAKEAALADEERPVPEARPRDGSYAKVVLEERRAGVARCARWASQAAAPSAQGALGLLWAREGAGPRGHLSSCQPGGGA
jgi:hypothetical protein